MAVNLVTTDNVEKEQRLVKRRRTLTWEERLEADCNSHPLKPPCSCPRKCIQLIEQRRRVEIHLEFRGMSYIDRKFFMDSSVTVCDANRRQQLSRERKVYYIYRLKDEQGVYQTVCKKFYLATLGHGETSSIVATAKRHPENLAPIPDQRGRKKLADNPLHNAIDAHIRRFNPCISHYCRELAPTRRWYLPHELTINDMCADYNQKHPENTINYTTYMRRIKKLNISFPKLGEEDCERCELLRQAPHQMEGGQCLDTCDTCVDKTQHLQLAAVAQTAYKTDGGNVVESKVVRSINLQEVVMLPRLQDFKSACSTRRLIVFHHTFAPVGPNCKKQKAVSVLWNEAISGRKCEDIVSSFQLALKEDRDVQEVVYYVDSGSAQNKNYALFTFLIAAVNATTTSIETLSLNYLETGHKVVSADNCQARVERAMKKKVNVWDFKDFVECVGSTRAKVITPSYTDFRQFDGQHSDAKLLKAHPLKLAHIRLAQFRRGSNIVFYKTSYKDANFKEFDYMKEKADLSEPVGRAEPRGISATKKSDILSNLVPLMPESRKEFWQQIPTAAVNDLIDNDD